MPNFKNEKIANMKGGVLIIGSLLWDKSLYDREIWWEKLDLNKKTKISLPIRYGRSSSENRKYTYSMVFSTSLEDTKRLGNGYYIPFRNYISTEKEFITEIKHFAKVEGFKGNRIAANWGAVCLKINPKIDKEKFDFLTKKWNSLVAENKENKKPNQTIPNLTDFGEKNEKKSMTENWMLNIEDDIFKNIQNVDFILATSNALRHRKSGEIKYPSSKEIAQAMFDGNYYEYFLRNRLEKITTKEDRIIAKILKRKYRISLKEMRKNWA